MNKVALGQVMTTFNRTITHLETPISFDQDKFAFPMVIVAKIQKSSEDKVACRYCLGHISGPYYYVTADQSDPTRRWWQNLCVACVTIKQCVL